MVFCWGIKMLSVYQNCHRARWQLLWAGSVSSQAATIEMCDIQRVIYCGWETSTHANRKKNICKLRKQLWEVIEVCYSSVVKEQSIEPQPGSPLFWVPWKHFCNLHVLRLFPAHVSSCWWIIFLNLHIFFLFLHVFSSFAVHWALSATVVIIIKW